MLVVVLAVLMAAIGAVFLWRDGPAQQPVGAVPETPRPGVASIAPASAAASATPSAAVTSSAVSEPDPETATPDRTRRPRPSATPTPATATPATATSVPATPTPTARPTLPVDATIDDALARCPTAAEIAFVDSRLRLQFFDDITAAELVCRASEGSADLTRLQERAYQAVLTMRRISFDAPLPWTDRSLFGWFTHAINGVDFSSTVDFSYCCNGRHIVIRSTADMGFLHDNRWRAPNPAGDGLSSLVGLMAHEARHAEGYLHTCAYSEAAGGYADDQTMEEMGAWAINILVFEWIAEHSDPAYMRPLDGATEFYQVEARDTAETLSRLRICDNYED